MLHEADAVQFVELGGIIRSKNQSSAIYCKELIFLSTKYLQIFLVLWQTEYRSSAEGSLGIQMTDFVSFPSNWQLATMKPDLKYIS